MNATVILQQMLVLFSMMLVGYFFFKKGVLDEVMEKKLSWIVVNFMNPCLILASVAGRNSVGNSRLIGQNFILVIILYAAYIFILSPLLHRVLKVPVEQRGLYTLMTTFSNLGFIGLPVVTSIYGKKAAIYVVFYMLSYNVLVYTYGLIIAGKYSKDGKGKVDLRRMLNPGNYSSVITILLFIFKIQMPAPIQSFLSYFGNATIPFSMILIGLSMAKIQWKELLQGKRVYLFCFFKLLVIPIAFIFLVRLLPFDAMLKGIFILLAGMPVGSITILIANEYGISGKEGTQGIILSTVFSVITLPMVAMLF